jgi:hypothetical protein
MIALKGLLKLVLQIFFKLSFIFKLPNYLDISGFECANKFILALYMLKKILDLKVDDYS